jgi:hypothetical protein
MKKPILEHLTTVPEEEVKEIVKWAHAGNGNIIETGDFVEGIRHALLYMMDKPEYRFKFTVMENYVASDALSRVVDAMQYDKETGYYEDRGNFIYRCTKSDFLALKRASKKL